MLDSIHLMMVNVNNVQLECSLQHLEQQNVQAVHVVMKLTPQEMVVISVQ
jgi:hypothetical protein